MGSPEALDQCLAIPPGYCPGKEPDLQVVQAIQLHEKPTMVVRFAMSGDLKQCCIMCCVVSASTALMTSSSRMIDAWL